MVPNRCSMSGGPVSDGQKRPSLAKDGRPLPQGVPQFRAVFRCACVPTLWLWMEAAFGLVDAFLGEKLPLVQDVEQGKARHHE